MAEYTCGIYLSHRTGVGGGGGGRAGAGATRALCVAARASARVQMGPATPDHQKHLRVKYGWGTMPSFQRATGCPARGGCGGRGRALVVPGERPGQRGGGGGAPAEGTCRAETRPLPRHARGQLVRACEQRGGRGRGAREPGEGAQAVR